MNKVYLENIRRLLDNLENTQEQVIEQVAEACAEAIFNGGLLYFFGTGHSHMICEEPFYRAGGLASIYPILETDLMLHEGASKSSSYERIEGLGNVVISHTPIGRGLQEVLSHRCAGHRLRYHLLLGGPHDLLWL